MATSFISDQSPYTVFKQDGSHQFYCRWTAKEDTLLSKAVAKHGTHKWTLVSSYIPGRTSVQCSTRWFGALNPNVHKGKWSKQEDKLLNESVRFFQMITKTSTSALPWNQVAESIPYRTGIQCQARWTEALDPAIRKGRWSPEEDRQLESAVGQYGCCWIRVASLIPTRTQRQCRTRWNQIHCKRVKTQNFMNNSKEDTPFSSNEISVGSNQSDQSQNAFLNDNAFNSLPILDPRLSLTVSPDLSQSSTKYSDMMLDDSFQKSKSLTVDDIIASTLSEGNDPFKLSSPSTLETDFPTTPIISNQERYTFNNNAMMNLDDPSLFYSFLNNSQMDFSHTEDYQKMYSS